MHFICHLAALGLLALSLALDSTALAHLGAVAGLAGAIAFAGFCRHLVGRLRRSAP
jgi:hypothetical protein